MRHASWAWTRLCSEVARSELIPRHVALALLASLVAISATWVGQDAVLASAGAASLSVEGSPFDPNGDGKRESVQVRLTLAQPGSVGLKVFDFDGRKVKVLARDVTLGAGSHTWSWQGRDGSGSRVPFGPYRVKATVDTADGTLRRAAWMTRAARVPYPKRPGSITVAIDPGHGGPAAGAVWRGRKEDAINLDIALRLEAMLKGAGIEVAMTRRTDRNVSPVGKDLNFDGKYTRVDELIARNDVGNQARADIHLALHNNASVCHCTRGTEMYTHFGRSWTPEGRKLAKFLLDEHITSLDRQPGYRAKRRGVASYPFKALKPYHRRLMPRPSLQPSVLGESLFIDWPSESRILGKRSGRTAIATAYFIGIARYLSWRPYGLRYQVLDAPRRAPRGSAVSAQVRLTNSGHRSSAGWRLTARVVKKVPRYDGRPRHGAVVASVNVPDGLAPGESIDVVLPGIPMPARNGAWLVKLDVRLPGNDHLSRHGVVGPQLRVDTVAP